MRLLQLISASPFCQLAETNSVITKKESRSISIFVKKRTVGSYRHFWIPSLLVRPDLVETAILGRVREATGATVMNYSVLREGPNFGDSHALADSGAQKTNR
jgi:hypothetical protein